MEMAPTPPSTELIQCQHPLGEGGVLKLAQCVLRLIGTCVCATVKYKSAEFHRDTTGHILVFRNNCG